MFQTARRYPLPSAKRVHLTGLILSKQDQAIEGLLAKAPVIRFSGMIATAKPEPHYKDLFRQEIETLVRSQAWKDRLLASYINGAAIALWALKRDGLPIVIGGPPRTELSADFADPKLYDPASAVAHWKETIPLTDTEAQSLLDKVTKLRSTSLDITSAGADYTSTLMDSITTLFDRAQAEGLSLSDFRREFSDVVPNRAKNVVEQIYRTRLSQQYGEERLGTIRGAGVRSPFIQYMSIADDRRTTICTAMAGYLAAASDDIWETWVPPNHYSCRSDLSPIPYLEAIRRGIAARTQDGKGLILTRGSRPFGNPPAYFKDKKGKITLVQPQEGFRRGEKHGLSLAA